MNHFIKFTLVCFCLLVIMAHGAVTLSGSLSSNTVLNDGDTAIISDTLIVPVGISLTVNGGAVIEAANKKPIIVSGILNIVGTQDNLAYFIPSGSSHWGGLIIENDGSASISGAFIDSAYYGIWNKSDDVSVSGCELSNCEKNGIHSEGTISINESKIYNNLKNGIYFNAVEDTLSVVNSIIFKNEESGIFVAGKMICDHNTIDRNGDYGIFVAVSVYDSYLDTVSNCIISNNSLKGIQTSIYTFLNINSVNNNIWNNSNDSLEEHVNYVSANPLFTKGYKITHRSPSRRNGIEGTYQGAYPWTGDLTAKNCGYIWEDTIFADTQIVLGDLVVPPDVNLTIDSNAVIKFRADSDWLKSGVDTGKGELIIYGNLDLKSTQSAPIEFTSMSTSLNGKSDADEWIGLIYKKDSVSIENLYVSNAVYGIWNQGMYMNLNKCKVYHCSKYGVYTDARDNELIVNESKFYDIYSYPIYSGYFSKKLRVTNTLMYTVIDFSYYRFHTGIYSGGQLYAANNTIANCNNSGIDLMNSDTLDTVINCIIIDSEKYGISGTSDLNNQPFCKNNITWDIQFMDYGGGIIPVSEIKSDPLFINEEFNNFYLKSNSPCVDGGVEISSITNDLDGAVRPLLGKSTGAAKTDIGCYEYDPSANKYPIVNIGSDTAVLENELVTFDGTQSYDPDGSIVEYHWTLNGTATVTSSEISPTYTYTTAGYSCDIILKVTDNEGLVNYGTKKLYVNRKPNAVAGNDTTINYGSELLFDASGSYDYYGPIKKWKWYFGDGDSSSLEKVDYVYKDPGTYTAILIVTDTFNVEDRDTLEVTVTDNGPIAPVIFSSSSDTTIYRNDSLCLSVAYLGEEPTTIQWQKDGIDIAEEDSSSFIISKAILNDSGSYRCIVSNSLGADTSDVINVDVENSAPTLSSIDTINIKEDFLAIVLLTNSDAVDLDGDSIFIVLSNGDNYSFSRDTIFPDENFNGELIVPVQVFDGISTSSAVNVIVNIEAVNDAPLLSGSLTDTAIGTDENLEYVIPLDLFTDIDIDDSIKISVTGLPTGFTFADNTISGSSSISGEFNIAVQGADNLNEMVSDTFLLTIWPQTEISEIGNNSVRKFNGLKALPNFIKHKDKFVELFVDDRLSGNGSISIFDALGDVIAHQSINIKNGGCFKWDLKNGNGIPVTSGVYIALLELKLQNGSSYKHKTKIAVQLD